MGRARLFRTSFPLPSRRAASFPCLTKAFPASSSYSPLPTTSSIPLYVFPAIRTQPVLTSISFAGGFGSEIRAEHRIHPRQWNASRACLRRRCVVLPSTGPEIEVDHSFACRSRQAGFRLPNLARASHASSRRYVSARTHSRVLYASRAAQAGTFFSSAVTLRYETHLLSTLQAPMLDVGDSCLESLRDVLDDVLDYSKFR
jgi:hypothetical protein